MGLNWPLTGRAEELRFVDAVVRRGAGHGVVLAGAAGVGKTRLAREAVAAARRRHARTVWVAATASARAVPLGAFAAVLTDVSGDATQLLRQAAEALTGTARGDVVVAVDDAHLLDALSASLVHQFVLRRVATVVLTVRSGEPVPDAVTALWKDGHLDRLEVQPLSEAETVALLEAVLGGPVDSAGAARLWTLCRGNALYLRQLVDGEVAGGGLRLVRGVWRWSGRPALSPGLADLVNTRMGRLSGAVRDVVDVLALGEPLGVPVLVALTSADGVEQAEAEGLVAVEPDGRRLEARLAHPLYGEVRREALGVLRARRLRGRIARALQDTGARRADDTMRRAVLVVDSDLDPDPRLHTLAAQRAIALLDVPLAARLARAAVDAGGGFEARVTLGSALSWLTRGDEAEAMLSALAPLATDDDQRSVVAVSRAGNLFFSCRRPAEAGAVLDRAESAITRPGALAPIRAIRGVFHAAAGRPREAIESAVAARSAGALPPHASLLAAWAAVGGLGRRGRAGELDRAAAPGYAAAEQSFDAVVPSFGLCAAHLLGLRLAGALRGVEDLARTRYRQGAEIPGPLQLLGVALLGYAALYRGRLGTAVRRLREAEAGLGPVRRQGPGSGNLVALTQALAMSGEAGQAAVVLAAAEDERHPATAVLEPELVLARAWVRAAEGAVSAAIRLARDAAGLAAGRGQPAFEVYALHVAVCFGDRTAAGRLAELAGQVEGPRAAAAAAQAAALAGEVADGLFAASRALEEMGDQLAAADAAAQAAVAHARSGHPVAARAAVTRAHRLAEACEGARTPALAAVRPLPLTGREREIVTMAARGLSNREIADRLVVSVRTVEGHLYRASAKLGVTERAAFAELLGF
ncbi:helix-turn-helix transcriptional regulator [Amycolatopsis thermalba]|uniref:helix-turn-helix transcriptional regulator n=1 Tax=Amycolatopsis thermalba TaxID=944492 RepID=UPI000E243EE1|nr:LuxR family transcriptional regulator [Amycolatopsis thermalba]